MLSQKPARAKFRDSDSSSLFCKKTVDFPERGAFSLIELLAVIAMVVVMASLLVPIVTSALRSAKETENISNLKTVAAATLLYAAEHDGKIPQYGWPVSIQTMGTAVAASSAPPRALFASDSPLGGHPRGSGLYLTDVRVLYNPSLTKVHPTLPATYATNSAGQPTIGYYFYSLPANADTSIPPRNPIEVNGKLLTNELLCSSWGRTPIYSDIAAPSLANDMGFESKNLAVAHVDGSVSVVSTSEALNQSTWAARLYYLATGTPPPK